MAWSRIIPTAARALTPILITLAAAACSGQALRPSSPNPAESPTTTPSKESGGSLAPSSTTLTATSPSGDTPTISIQRVEPGEFSRDDLAQTAFDYTTRLAKDLGPRASATDQEKAAADFLAGEFAGMGYQVHLQPFTVRILSPQESSFTFVPPPSGAALDPGVLDDIEINLLSGSGTGEASGILTHVGLAMSDDIPEQGLEGRVALIQRGTVTFRQKVNQASQAGAVAAVIYNNVAGNFQGTLGRPDPDSIRIPVLSVSDEDGAKFLEALSQGEVTAKVSVVRKELSSSNVIAEKPGPGDDVVVLGAHYDSVPDVPGANDNASGTAVLLTVAKSLAGRDLPFTVRFIPFGSEELGLRGSQAYIDSLTEEEAARIAAMLNFDALASGVEVRILGASRLTTMGIELGKSLDIRVTQSAGTRGSSSDHATFNQAGIPAIMFTAPDFSRIHTPDDTLEFVQPGLLGDSARLALAMLQSPQFPGSP